MLVFARRDADAARQWRHHDAARPVPPPSALDSTVDATAGGHTVCRAPRGRTDLPPTEHHLALPPGSSRAFGRADGRPPLGRPALVTDERSEIGRAIGVQWFIGDESRLGMVSQCLDEPGKGRGERRRGRPAVDDGDQVQVPLGSGIAGGFQPGSNVARYWRVSAATNAWAYLSTRSAGTGPACGDAGSIPVAMAACTLSRT